MCHDYRITVKENQPQQRFPEMPVIVNVDETDDFNWKNLFVMLAVAVLWFKSFGIIFGAMADSTDPAVILLTSMTALGLAVTGSFFLALFLKGNEEPMVQPIPVKIDDTPLLPAETSGDRHYREFHDSDADVIAHLDILRKPRK